MSLIPVAVAVMSLLGGQKAPQTSPKVEYRKLQVKAAGIELSVPKRWQFGRKDGNVLYSLRLPVEGTKANARLDIGYVLDKNNDADAYQQSLKDILTQQGVTVEQQYKVDILGFPFAVTKFAKDNETTSRGILFRNTEGKLSLTLAVSPEHYAKVEPVLQQVLETLKDIPVEQPRQAVIATEKSYKLSPEGFPISRKRQQAHLVNLGGEMFELLLPKAAKVSKLGESSFSALMPGLAGTNIITCYPLTGQQSQDLLINKVNESLNLFSGAVKRVDSFRRMSLGENQRFMIVREGNGAKDGKPLMTIDTILVGVDGGVIHVFYLSSNAKAFKSEVNTFRGNLETTRIYAKK